MLNILFITKTLWFCYFSLWEWEIFFFQSARNENYMVFVQRSIEGKETGRKIKTVITSKKVSYEAYRYQ